MKQENLSDICKTEAISLGLCSQWAEEWEDNSTKDVLIDKYLRGIDFCLKHNFPSVDFIKEKFGEAASNRGIFCDQSIVRRNDKMLVLLGNCTCSLVMDGRIGEVYIRHGSELTLTAQNGAKVWINALDFSKVKIKTDEQSKVYVHNYGDAEIEKDENVSLVNRKGFFGESMRR